MDLIPNDLWVAAQGARERLAGLSRDAAVAAARGGTPAQAGMAETARQAIFSDALLSAMHARLEELRGVAK
jgi:hypothetical protein